MLHSSVLYFTSRGIWSITRKKQRGYTLEQGFSTKGIRATSITHKDEPSGQPHQRALEGKSRMPKKEADKNVKKASR